MNVVLVIGAIVLVIVGLAAILAFAVESLIIGGIYGGREAYEERCRRNAEIHEEWERRFGEKDA